LEVREEFLEVFVNPASFEPTGFLAFEWAGSMVFELRFDAVNFSNL